MDRSVSRAAHDSAGNEDTATVPVSGMQWIFVAHQQVGLLHRLRPVARASTSLVLVRMDAGAHPCPDVQLGLAGASTAPRLEEVRWFAGLSAHDVATLLTWLSAKGGLARDVPAELFRRSVPAARLVR